jgi:hypothetical protein
MRALQLGYEVREIVREQFVASDSDGGKSVEQSNSGESHGGAINHMWGGPSSKIMVSGVLKC